MLSRLTRPNGTNVATIYRNLSTLTATRTKQTRCYHILKMHQTPAIASIGLRYASQNPDLLPSFAATPPAVPEMIDELAASVAPAVTETTLASIGLGTGWWPTDFVQLWLEYLHIGCDLPWWGAIGLTTLALRICLFPVVLKMQRNAFHMQKHIPQLTLLQAKVNEARHRGDTMEAARLGQEVFAYMKKHNCNPAKNLSTMLIQAPVFISMFFGIRGMAEAPVLSMHTGGFAWFTDLTISDPLFILPAITSITLSACIEVGADGVSTKSAPQQMRAIIRLMPYLMLPFIVNFPAAILWYWACNNAISFGQVLLLKVPSVREYFKLPSQAQINSIADNLQNIPELAKKLENQPRLGQMPKRK